MDLYKGAEVAKSEFAPGLPDPARFGRVTTLPAGRPLRWVIQRHLAERAGPHFDIRMGPDHGHKPTMLSWAARRLPEEPGQKTLAFMQPLHTGAYSDFEGEIVSGYGKGVVKTHDKGAVLVTKVSPDKINFVIIHRKHPETFTMIRKSGPPAGDVTERTRKTQGGTWLLVNTTPTEVIKHKKVHYAKVPAEEVHKLFDPEYLHQEKLDGSAALYKLFSDRIEALSYRPTTTGRPIVHTYRVGGMTGVNIPKHLVGSVLRGEIFGVRTPTGEAIPAQELGGILNASTLRALQKKQEQRVKLKNAIFNVLRYGKTPVSIDEPLARRMELLKEIMEHLPADTFRLPRSAATVEEQKKLWDDIRSGKYPLTHEGVVAWPRKGGKPTKVKLYKEHDVHVKEIFPGEGRLAGVGAGGFRYALKPGGSIVGEVGTGFSEEVRRQMHEHPEEFVGRIARIKAQEQFPSGAYRAPAFIALHEDYPGAQKAAMALFQGQDFSALRAALGGEAVPHLEIEPSDVAGGIPAELVAFAPAMTAGLAPQVKAVMERMPELAAAIRRSGAIVTPAHVAPAEFAHELGHATGIGKSRLYSGLAGMSGIVRSPLGLPVPGGGTLIGALAGIKKKSPKVAALAAMLVSSPILFEELRANLRARRALKQTGGWGPKARGALIGSYLSYLLPSAGSAALAALAALAAKKLMKRAGDGAMKKLAALTPEEIAAAQQQAASMLAPTTGAELAKTLATGAVFVPTLSTAWGGLRALGRGVRHPMTPLVIGGEGGIAGALKRRWAPKELMRGAKGVFSPTGIGLSGAFEGIGALTGAMADPEYRQQQIGYARALARQLGHMGRGAALKTHETFSGRLGPVFGLATSPIHAFMNPIATTAAFGQALKRLVSKKEAGVLEAAIKQSTDGECGTLVELVKRAGMFTKAPPPALSPEVAKELGVKTRKYSIADRLRALLTGMTPEELVSLRQGAGGVASLVNKIKSIVPLVA